MPQEITVYYSKFMDNYVLIGLATSDQAALRLYDFQTLDLPLLEYLQCLSENPDTLLEQQTIQVESEYDQLLTLTKLGDRVRGLLRQYDENQVMVMLLNNRTALHEEEDV